MSIIYAVRIDLICVAPMYALWVSFSTGQQGVRALGMLLVRVSNFLLPQGPYLEEKIHPVQDDLKPHCSGEYPSLPPGTMRERELLFTRLYWLYSQTWESRYHDTSSIDCFTDTLWWNRLTREGVIIQLGILNGNIDRDWHFSHRSYSKCLQSA